MILVHQLLHHLVVLSDGLVVVCVGHLESRRLLQGGGLGKTLVVIVCQRIRELLLLDLLML